MKATIEIPDGYTLVKVNDTEYKVVKEEKKLPNTWEEFCETHQLKEKEAWIDDCSKVKIIGCAKGGDRTSHWDSTLPNKEYAEAILALIQLIQLRNCYNDGWVPDWSKEEVKDCLYLDNGKWKFSLNSNHETIFAFKSPELCRKFLENFRDLLDKIKPLYQ